MDLTWEAWLTLSVVVVTVMSLARDWLAPPVAILGANIVLLVTGVIDADAALSGFSNPAPMTVAALFVVARAVERTGALQPLMLHALGNGDGGYRSRLARLLIPTAAASAVLNNTPIVAMLGPQVADWSHKRGHAASKLLMPLSFATILGGTLTVIGTSTNLVVSGLLQAHGQAPIAMFELSRIGLPIAVLGVGLMIVFASRLLPDRRPAHQQFREESREYVVHQVVVAGGPLDGQTVEEAGLRHLQGVFLAEIERGREVIAPAAPSTVLRGGDRLTFAGRVDLVRDLQTMRGLEPEEQKHTGGLDSLEHTFFEAAVSGSSALVGRTLSEASFRSTYQAAVLAIHRAGERVRSKLGEVRLKEGDTLLLLADGGFAERWRDRSEFLLVSHLGGTPPASTRKGWFVAAVTLGIVAAAALGIMPILEASLLGAVALVVGRALTAADARSAIELGTLVVIAASFGIGAAIQSSGLAAVLAGGIVEAASFLGPIGVLLAVVAVTVALTEAITNNAAAVLMFPVAVSSAAAVGADPRPFAIALAIAASASFITPIGYQTNTMVYALGGYRFGDFARLGAPLTVLVIVTIVLLVPVFWPF